MPTPYLNPAANGNRNSITQALMGIAQPRPQANIPQMPQQVSQPPAQPQQQPQMQQPGMPAPMPTTAGGGLSAIGGALGQRYNPGGTPPPFGTPPQFPWARPATGDRRIRKCCPRKVANSNRLKTMSFLKPDPPTPPSPTATAGAQTASNVSTALANHYLNNVNQNTPEGSLTYEDTGSYQFTDPSNGQTYNIPLTTATQTLSPQGEAIKNQQDATKYNLAGMANAQSGRISSLLSNEMNFGTAPAAGNAQNIANIPGAKTSYDSGGPIQSQFGDAGQITRDYGPADNFSADRGRVEEALYGRLNPQLQRDRAGIEQRLADQGIRYGSQAYASAMDDYNRQSTDARLAVTAAGGAEQQRMNQMEAQRAAFQNTAQGQAYEQAQGRGAFANQAQAQQYAQNAQGAGFYNQGLAQQLAQQQSAFNAANAGRSQYMNEQYAQRNQPVNEISALLSGYVQNPNFVNAPSTQIPTTDIAGLTNTNFAQNQQNYAQQSQNINALVGGAAGAAAGWLRSDKRSKENIHKMGTVFSAAEEHDEPGSIIGDAKELPIYEYSYKDDPASVRHVGPMAQDVETIDPKAVKSIGGVKHIDRRRVMGSILRAA